jgi:hypothetical protein
MSNFVPIEVPLINGVLWSFAHIEVQIAGLSFHGGFKAIKYSRERKREKVYSNSPDPVGQTLGQNEYTGSCTVYLAWWQAMLATVQQTLGPGYGDQAFTVLVSYEAEGFAPIQDVLLGCHLDSTKADQSVGTTALEREVDLNPLKILFNGIDDLATPLRADPQ